jgi:hypothetical protein
MDRFFIKGTKKLFSLTKTKIRLATEAGTIETRPAPLPLVKRFTGKEIATVKEAGEYTEELRKTADFSDDRRTAETVLMLIDIIEGVKYRFEPQEYCALLGRTEMKTLEDAAKEAQQNVNILLLAEERGDGINLFIGEDPPPGVVHAGRLVSNLASFLDYALKSDHFSENGRLKNIRASAGRKTLLAAAVYAALRELGAAELPA